MTPTSTFICYYYGLKHKCPQFQTRRITEKTKGKAIYKFLGVFIWMLWLHIIGSHKILQSASTGPTQNY